MTSTKKKEISVMMGELMLIHYSIGKQIRHAEETLTEMQALADTLKYHHRRLGLIISPKDRK